jgi:chemotaxis protein CheD
MIAVNADQRASRHYFDREFDIQAVKLLPGEYYVTSDEIVLTTVLGSCVSACVRDSIAGVGGMNHFMLPDDADPTSRDSAAAMRYGSYAMNVLLNELIKIGAKRERLEAKVFGGGAVLANMTLLNIGDRNADFVLRYLQRERVRVVAQDLRGKLPRRVNYFHTTGRVTVRKLHKHEDVLMLQEDEQVLVSALLMRQGRTEVGLFDQVVPKKLERRITSGL